MQHIIQKSGFLLSMYTAVHFLVDLACIFYLMGMVYVMLPSGQMRVQAAVLYNLCAFALPMLLGLIADVIGFNAATSCLGCLMILLVYLTVPRPWTAVVLIGVGNGLFHIGGGRQVLQDAEKKYAPSGIFICSGAWGVFLGKVLAGYFRQAVFISLWVLMAVSMLLLAVCSVEQYKDRVVSNIRCQGIGRQVLSASLLIFAVVIIRSYYGFLTSYSWNHSFYIGLIFTLCIVAGKCLGGILADRFGVRPASIFSLGGAGILALFAGESPVTGCLSILLFNMTMPITLTLLAGFWKQLPGFAFGTLMMALFLGTLPNMVFHVSWLGSPAGMLLLCLISMMLLLTVVKLEHL